MIKAEGVKKAISDLGNIRKNWLKNTLEVFSLNGVAIVKDAKANHPSFKNRTSNAEKSISYKIKKKEHEVEMIIGVIGNYTKTNFQGLSYTTFLHEGTRFIKGDPFIYNAINRGLSKFEKDLKAIGYK